MLKQRVITAMIMGLVFLLSLFLLPSLGFSVFITLVLLVGAWEWSNLAGYGTSYQRLSYCICTLLLIALVAFYTRVIIEAGFNAEAVRHVLLIAGIWWAVALLWIQSYPSSALLWGHRLVRAIMGWLVLVPAWLALSYLHHLDHGALLILLVIVIVFVADTGAYFVGRRFGRRKLAFQVSPGKSWEGFWGGLLCCVLLAVVVAAYVDFRQWLALLLVVVLTALASVVGDLLESMVKRHRDIKDSSHLLPGHGGVMDRLDSITAAAPVFVLGIMLSGWTL